MEQYLNCTNFRYEREEFPRFKTEYLNNNPDNWFPESLVLQLLDFTIDSVFKWENTFSEVG